MLRRGSQSLVMAASDTRESWVPDSLPPPDIIKLSFKYNQLTGVLAFLYAVPYTDFSFGNRWTSSDPTRQSRPIGTGRAQVTLNGNPYVINKTGNILLDPTCDLTR